jgi:hypothetical protein
MSPASFFVIRFLVLRPFFSRFERKIGRRIREKDYFCHYLLAASFRPFSGVSEAFFTIFRI